MDNMIIISEDNILFETIIDSFGEKYKYKMIKGNQFGIELNIFYYEKSSFIKLHR